MSPRSTHPALSASSDVRTAGASRFRIGDCELDLAAHELRRSGVVIAIQPRPYWLLVYLARNRDRVVPSAELFSALWPGIYVSSAALASALRDARRALGERASSDSSIRTLRGRGYRLICDVEPGVESDPGTSLERACFVGRAEQLRVAESALRQDGAVVLVRGERGIGRSRFLAELECALPDRKILRARFTPDRWAPRYEAMAQLLSQARLLLGSDRFDSRFGGEPCRRLITDELPRPWSGSPAELAASFARVIGGASEQRSVTIMVDDVQCADRASRIVLAGCAERTRGSVTFALASTDPSPARGWPEQASSHGSPADTELTLPRLTRTDVRALAASELGTTSHALGDRLFRDSGGLPSILSVLAGESARGERRGGAVVPAAVRSLIEERLERLSIESNRVVSAVAWFPASAPPPDRAQIARVAELEPAEVESSIRQAVTAGLLEVNPRSGDVRFAIGIARQVIRESIPCDRQRQLELRQVLARGVPADCARGGPHWRVTPTLG